MKFNDGLCSLEEYKRMAMSIVDAVDEWINYYNHDTAVGICIDPISHQVSLDEQNRTEVEWHDILLLIDNNEPDITAIYELTDNYCFVR